MHKENYKLIEIFLEKKFFDFVQLEEILQIHKSFFKDFIKILIFKKKILSKRNEEAPVFFHEALDPKVNFDTQAKLSNFQILKVDRCLLSIFGFPAYGVHCNGWKKKGKFFYMILSKRSKQINSFPGLFDNIIGGGQPNNLSFRENLDKEGYEEAGIKKNILENARFNSFTKYFLTFKETFNPSVIATFDLEIKNSFSLINKDGEVDEFKMFRLEEIMELLEKNQLKPNSIIPITNFILKKIENFFNESTLKEINKILCYEK